MSMEEGLVERVAELKAERDGAFMVLQAKEKRIDDLVRQRDDARYREKVNAEVLSKRMAELEVEVSKLEAFNNGKADEIGKLQAERDRLQQALCLVDEEEGCCGPGEWCHYKTYSEIAIEFTDMVARAEKAEARVKEARALLEVSDLSEENQRENAENGAFHTYDMRRHDWLGED